MEYLYSCLWFGVGIYLIIKGIKDYKFLCIFGAYFIFLGGWWLADELLPSIDLLNDQPYANIVRVISAIIVGFGIYKYIKQKRKTKEEN